MSSPRQSLPLPATPRNHVRVGVSTANRVSRTSWLLLVAFPTLVAGSWFGNDYAGGRNRYHIAAAAEVDWKIGLEFRKALEQPIGLKWAENPIRDAMRNLSNNQQVAIWLDRRIDPSSKLQFELEDMPLAITLDQLCEKYKVGRSVVGPVIYIGPAATAEKLATLAAVKRQQVGQQSASERARWSRAVAWKVPMLAEPRELVRQLVSESGATLQNPEAIPHDLWPAIPLPPLTLADRLTLVLAGFDLTFEQSPDGSTIRIVSMPEKVEYEQSYAWRGQNQSLAAQLQKKFPEIKVRVEESKVVVTGRYETHELIDRMMSGETVRTAKVVPGSKVFSLRVDNQPAGAVVKTVAKELGKEMTYDPALVEKLRTNVSFNVKDVKLEELLATVLTPLELTFEITESSLVIKPAKPE